MTKELPEGWTWTTLGQCGDFLNGLAFKEEDWSDNGIPIIRIQNLTNPAAKHNYTRRVVDEKYTVTPGTILVSWSATLDAFRWEGPLAIVNQHIFKVTPRTELVCPKYLYFLLKHTIRGMIQSDSLHGSTMKHINRGPFLSQAVELPPLAEQRRIVAKIEELTARSRAARAALAEVPALLEQFRQSVLASAFRGDLTADWRVKNPAAEPASVLLERIRTERRKQWETKYPKKKYAEPEPVDDSELPELPEGWCWAVVEELASATDYGTSAKTNEDASGVPVLRMGNIVDGALSLSSLKYLPLNHNEFPRLLLNLGDLLFNRTNSPELVGKAAVYAGNPERCSFASYLIRVKPEGLLPELLAGYINSPYGRAWVRSVTQQQVGQANVNGTKLLALAVPIPPAHEQQVIAQRIAAAQRLVVSAMELQEANVADLDTLDQSILAKAFRGELVPQDPADEPALVLLERIEAGVDEATLGLLGFAVAGTTDPRQLNRTKCQKFGYLAVTHLGYPAALEFGQSKAGPYADELRRAEEFAARRGYFTVYDEPNVDPDLSAATRFTPGPHLPAGRDLGRRHFGTRADDGQRLLEEIIGMTTPDAELFGTAYAVWRQLHGETGTADDAAITAGVHAWHVDKPRKFPAEAIRRRLSWMREMGYTPTGGVPATPALRPKQSRKRKG